MSKSYCTECNEILVSAREHPVKPNSLCCEECYNFLKDAYACHDWEKPRLSKTGTRWEALR